MKLLLTSAGLTTQAITDKLFELVGKPATETTITMIPTAMNPEGGDKGWFVDNLNELRATGCKELDILDITSVAKEVWLPRLHAADVICMGGGYEEYLADILREKGLAEELQTLLKTKVYMGISAGSMVVGNLLQGDAAHAIYPWNKGTVQGLELTDITIIPHYGKSSLPNPNKTNEKLQRAAELSGKTIHALGDQSALKVVDEEVEIIGEGVEIFNQN